MDLLRKISCVLMIGFSIYQVSAQMPADTLGFKNMILVTGGRFIMGETGSFKNPAHGVELNNFYIGKFEVTLVEFTQFINETGYITVAEKMLKEKRSPAVSVLKGKELIWSDKATWRNPGFKQQPDEPVTCVTWSDAIAYCNWLSKKHGQTPVYTINDSYDFMTWPNDWNTSRMNVRVKCNLKSGFRLPTAAEWEYSAQGGAKTQNFIYSGNNSLDEVGWYKDNSNKRTHLIGQKKANELGIYDMSGNVCEWCQDSYTSDKTPYQNSEYKVVAGNEIIYELNPCFDYNSNLQVVRGGSWFDDVGYLLILKSWAYKFSETSTFHGFRIVCPVLTKNKN